MAKKIIFLKKAFFSSLMALLGIKASAVDFRSEKKSSSEIPPEKMIARMRPAVYGGPENLVDLEIYGKVLFEKTKEPAPGILVRLYMNQNYLLEEVRTDRYGNFAFETQKVWEGIEDKRYQIVVGEWFDEEPLGKKEIIFQNNEVQKEVIFLIKAEKKSEYFDIIENEEI